MAVIEIMTFRLRPGADEDRFLEADRLVQTDFAYHQSGLARRTTARDGGNWIVIDLWATAEHADAMSARWDESPATAAFMAHVDTETLEIRRYHALD